MCLDIGGTRVKAAILPKSLTADAVTALSVFTMRSLGWLNASLPELLNADNWASVVSRLSSYGEFAEVAIGVPGAVRDGRFLRSDINVPVDLRDRFSEFINTEVTLVKDADAWMVGATAYSEMWERPMHFPWSVFTFGTGVGLSLARDSKHFESLELSEWPESFPSLASAAGVAIDVPWQVHAILGKDFFEWVAASKRHWSYPRIREEFTRRVVALLNDLMTSSESPLHGSRTLTVGGGNAEYVSLRSLASHTGCDVRSLSRQSLGIDPDLIPLLGLHKIVYGQSINVRT